MFFERRVPEWVRHAPAPGVRGFATLNGIEAMTRGILISVYPLAMYRAFGDAALVSTIYFCVGCISLICSLTIPRLTRTVPRRWVYTGGGCLYLVSAALAISGGPNALALALLFNTVATVTVFVCLNAYVLDYISKVELGRCETLRMFYSAFAWTAGPVCGVYAMSVWPPMPFLISAGFALVLLATFWWMRLGNGKLITRALGPAPNPYAYLGRFLAQPRLVAGWLFAVLRSCGWWIYVVYLPIFAVQQGLGDAVGSTALSITNAFLFATPLMLAWMQRRSVRHAVRTGFLLSGVAFVSATLVSGYPWMAVGLLFVGSIGLILLDICGGLPFLMAVKPSERTEMSAVYSTFRDISGVVSPGVAWLVLLVSPISGVFCAAGAGLLAAWTIAGSLHPRLGRKRIEAPPLSGAADTS